MTHKNTKWAKQILALQDEEGKWGYFHSLSQDSKTPLTTEQALRRLEILGYTMEDECIQKAVGYMGDCLAGKKEIPDRREKLHSWDIFTSILSYALLHRVDFMGERGTRFMDKTVEVNQEIVDRLNGIYDELWAALQSAGPEQMA